ncbi:hypothetical protein B0T24DRAFT_613524 [Lasiosphaeria ovina]|uniref:Uncharacterized protein n=1 Tax=Lasiosphaeria ovina TaxID=92902 RepID=A0AAE0TT64_9PEZI|nr:hypothetical protein B0T24DRAFT_613524 [Lasiosphaeria ovina]
MAPPHVVQIHQYLGLTALFLSSCFLSFFVSFRVRTCVCKRLSREDAYLKTPVPDITKPIHVPRRLCTHGFCACWRQT